MSQFRLLTAREIDCRAQQIKENGVSLLLYKDARCDMSILDEAVGSMNWMRQHTRDNANCVVSIWDEAKGQWISKEDTGTESNTEAEKGLASDSFKRACVNWGIGRELYTAPFIWIGADKCRIEKNQKGQFICKDKFSVESIAYNEHREISGLTIVNQKGAEVYRMGQQAAEQQKPPQKPSLPPCANVRFLDGKYQGKTIAEVWKADIGFIKEYLENGSDSWIMKNIEDFRKYLKENRNG